MSLQPCLRPSVNLKPKNFFFLCINLKKRRYIKETRRIVEVGKREKPHKNQWLVLYKKGKVFLVHAMKAHRVSRGTAPLILNLGTRWR
jgi:hypothetical protein